MDAVIGIAVVSLVAAFASGWCCGRYARVRRRDPMRRSEALRQLLERPL